MRPTAPRSRYWEEAVDVADAAILALRLWETHRATAGLPAWDVVGLEVVDQGTFQRRGHAGELTVRLAPAGAATTVLTWPVRLAA